MSQIPPGGVTLIPSGLADLVGLSGGGQGILSWFILNGDLTRRVVLLPPGDDANGQPLTPQGISLIKITNTGNLLFSGMVGPPGSQHLALFEMTGLFDVPARVDRVTPSRRCGLKSAGQIRGHEIGAVSGEVLRGDGIIGRRQKSARALDLELRRRHMSESKIYEGSGPVCGNISPDTEIPIRERLKLSRRKFLGCVAAAVAGTLVAPRRAMAIPGYGDPSKADAEAGFVTLDGFMLTYFTAPPAIVSSTFTFGKNFSATINLSLPQSPDTKLVARVPIRDEEPTTGDYSEYDSERVENGIILRSDFNRFIRGTEDGLGVGPLPPGPASIYGLLQPVLKFVGTPDKLHFFFFQHDRGVRRPI
ncbi:MAG TPA: hypothetical protein VI756_03825 [Blastocatellia bacterium]